MSTAHWMISDGGSYSNFSFRSASAASERSTVVSPYRDVREEIRVLHDGRFFEVYVSTPVEVCSDRDVKGLYAKQKAGDLTGLTGVDDPYEPPINPELVVPTHIQTLEESVEAVWQALHS